MPDLEPVSGDPFASMTHWPDQPAQPYMHPNVPTAASALAGFATGGLQGAGMTLPDWAASNPVQRALQNPDNEAALGMARPFGALSARGQLGKFELSDLHKDFQAGLNNQQIADKYNVTKEAIQQRRTQMGYPPKPRGRPWPSRLEPVSHDPFADETEPLQREVITRGRSGRPIQTAPLPIGNVNAVLSAGASKVNNQNIINDLIAPPLTSNPQVKSLTAALLRSYGMTPDEANAALRNKQGLQEAFEKIKNMKPYDPFTGK